MAEESITTGDKIVLMFGSVISFGKTPIEIRFETIEKPELKEELFLVFSFHEDDTKKVRLTTHLAEDSKKMELKLYNFNSGMDTGNISPMTIGETNGHKEIYLNYRARKTGDSWTLDFTIYQTK